MARRSTTHRRIVNDKADYISARGFVCDEAAQPQLAAFVRRANGDGESLRQVLNKLAFDKALFGNAFLEAVTDAGHSFLSLYHQDATRCRVARDSRMFCCTTTGAPSAHPRRGGCRSTRSSRSSRTARCARWSTTRTTNRRSSTTAFRPISPG